MEKKVILFFFLTYFQLVFSYTCKCSYNDKPFEYCCYDEIIEVDVVSSSDNMRNLEFLYNLIAQTEMFLSDSYLDNFKEYEEIQRIINSVEYGDRKLLEYEGGIYKRIIDSKNLSTEQKNQLQFLRISKKKYHLHLESYGKINDDLGEFKELFVLVDKDTVLIELHKKQLLALIETRIKDLSMEEF